jgi:tetratricopeptide (TPR) repeat protein
VLSGKSRVLVAERTVEHMTSGPVVDTSKVVINAERPQPVGAFPLPAGYLIVPVGDTSDALACAEARIALLAGKVPTHWPDSLTFLRLSHDGDSDGALAALDQFDPNDPITRYNRYVLDPESIDPSGLREAMGGLGAMVDVVRYAIGETDNPPEDCGETNEIRALVLATRASHLASEGLTREAIPLLIEAADSSESATAPLAGQLLAAAASLIRSVDGPTPEVIEHLTRALDLLRSSELLLSRAEIHVELGSVWQELASAKPSLLTKAVQQYHSALSLVTADSAPELFASAQSNLATAYLTMPMIEATDQLRLGIAVQSLRAALTVYTPERHPEHWASTQLNLANALVYAPSTHQGDNLVEAVELYEAVLERRDRHIDPLGKARVLSNQGNALAHLGVFDQAKSKLFEARFIFEEFEDVDSVRAVRGVLDEIAREEALAGSQL